MLELQNVSKSFFKKEALSDVSLKIDKGEIVGLLGPNGAGKTTLMRIINRIVEPDSGSVRFDGNLMTSKDLLSIGYLPEERGLYQTMTVQKQMEFIGRLRGLSKNDVKQKIDFWLEKFEITNWRKKRIEELSKGMAQKIQFICSVLHEPKLLILDEPFSGFDPINVELIRKEIIQMRADGRTILLSTHNMNSVDELCDRAILMNNSKKIAEGTISELQDQCKIDNYIVRFKGNMIAFVNALWAGFEIIDKKDLGDSRFEVQLAMRRDNTFEDLLKVLIGQIEIEGAWEMKPSMNDVFIHLVNPKIEENEK